MRLNDPELVQNEYASDERLAVRMWVYRELVEGPNPEDVAFAAVAEAAPGSVLDVGCGVGALASRIAAELGSRVVAIDTSARMVELARRRGVDARVGDVQALPFADGEFDCAIANWMLYHVPDLELGLRELARVLRPGGRLVAGTISEDNMPELWQLLGDDGKSVEVSFTRENGQEQLLRHFAGVEWRDVEGSVTFPDREAVRRYVSATIRRAHLADRVPDLPSPLRTRTVHAIFVAETAA